MLEIKAVKPSEEALAEFLAVPMVRVGVAPTDSITSLMAGRVILRKCQNL